jgi:hypothetical protein
MSDMMVGGMSDMMVVGMSDMMVVGETAETGERACSNEEAPASMPRLRITPLHLAG